MSPARCHCLLLLALAAAPAGAAELTAGPMPGHSAMRAARIWLQADGPAEAVLEYWRAGEPETRRRTAPTPLTADEAHAATLDITGLEPGGSYRYRVLLDGEPVDDPPEAGFRTQPLWQWREDPPPFTAALGSCAFINDPPYDRPGRPYGGDHGIFDVIAERAPALMLWLGDTLYFREADTGHPWAMDARYRQVRAFGPLQRLLRGTHHYAIWDDHDYGPNNSNRSFPLKAHSLALFRRYWANPSSGLPGAPGIFTRFSFHDVDFFLLDDRWYRDADHGPDHPGKTLFGATQLNWLKQALLASRAPFKLIAAGSQLLNAGTRAEGWHHFPAERDAFLAWLADSGVPGVVFLSGDRHHSELLRRTDVAGYPLYELTCSPLTSGARTGDAPNPLRVADTLVAERNFCELGFSGPRRGRVMTVTVRGTDGAVRWRREIAADALRPRRAR